MVTLKGQTPAERLSGPQSARGGSGGLVRWIGERVVPVLVA
jgi:hypothetical protein